MQNTEYHSKKIVWKGLGAWASQVPPILLFYCLKSPFFAS